MNFDGETDINDDNDFWYIEINYPYEYIKDKFIDNGDLFIVQQKLQISYTFKFDYLTKNYKILDSNLN
jgi:hypothetical protein